MTSDRMMKDFSTKSEEDKGHYRSLFNRDRDRIIYSRNFLRLGGKTQVFVNGYDDHMRNRLSHTLEVVQIAVKISKALGLNVDLTEAIAFGHDIGHTPFGHAGERVLNKAMNGCYLLINDIDFNPAEGYRGFKHNWQGIRVVRDLITKYDGKPGLELSKYTEWGILKHSKLKYSKCKRIIKNKYCGNNYDHTYKCKSVNGFSLDFYENLYNDINKLENLSLEGIVVERADEIAQRHHDIEDGLIANLITVDEIRSKLPSKGDPIYQRLYKEEKELLDLVLSNQELFLGRKIKILSHLMHGIYSRDIIFNSKKNFKKFSKDYSLSPDADFQQIKNNREFKEKDFLDLVDFTDGLKRIDQRLKKYLKNSILNSRIAQAMDSKAEYIIIKLIKAYLRYPQYLPKKTISDILNRINERHSYILNKDEFKKDVIDFVANKHFTKLSNTTYLSYFMRGICDFIAGMTDDFAYKQFDLIYGTNKFSNNKVL